MTEATITETQISDGTGAIMLHDATGKRLRVALYGRPLFHCDRDEALAVITDYAARHGINIVETQTEETE